MWVCGRITAGSARPGCVQLRVSALMTGAELQQLRGSFTGMVQQLASSGLGCGLQTGILGQLGSQAVLVDGDGSEVAVLDLESSGAAAPEVRGRIMCMRACMYQPLAHTPHAMLAYPPGAVAVASQLTFCLPCLAPLMFAALQICSVRPLVMTPCYSGPILVTGHNIGTPADTIFCSNGGERGAATVVLYEVFEASVKRGAASMLLGNTLLGCNSAPP